MGYHRRTEYNKRIMRIGVDGNMVTPKGGFVRYGMVKGPHVLLKGSVPGPKKRLVRLRVPARLRKIADEPPKVMAISVESQQR